MASPAARWPAGISLLLAGYNPPALPIYVCPGPKSVMGGSPVCDRSGVQELVIPEEQEVKRAAAAPVRSKPVPQHNCALKFMHSSERNHSGMLSIYDTPRQDRIKSKGFR